MSAAKTAQYMGISLAYLRKLCCARTGPRFAKVGRRIVFKLEDIEEWLDKRVVEPVSGDSSARRGRPRKAVTAGGAD